MKWRGKTWKTSKLHPSVRKGLLQVVMLKLHSLNGRNDTQVLNYCFVTWTVLKDPDSNPYSLLEGEGELADADISEGMGDRRRRSRRRRNDQEPSVMDAAAESDSQAGPSENGLGESCGGAFSLLKLVAVRSWLVEQKSETFGGRWSTFSNLTVRWRSPASAPQPKPPPP